MSSINKDLETVQKAWFENNLRPWLEKRSKFILENKKFSNYFKKKCIEKGVDSKEEKETLSFTEPFYTAFLDNQGHDKTVMFVGKETHGFGNINDNDEPDEMGRIRNTHQWMLNTMKVNIRQTNCVKIPGINYNTHPFFRAMRAIAQKYNVCWNNLDKIQYVSENVKSMTLYEADELELNSIIKNTEYNTLLIEEINAIQPDMIVFAVGPSYEASLMCSINKGKGKIKKPNLDAQIQEFALNMGNIRIPCLWTYHPGYYKGFKIDDVLEKIDNTI